LLPSKKKYSKKHELFGGPEQHRNEFSPTAVAVSNEITNDFDPFRHSDHARQ
jgi:hypothetical protein